MTSRTAPPSQPEGVILARATYWTPNASVTMAQNSSLRTKGGRKGNGFSSGETAPPRIGPVRREDVPGRLFARRRDADPEIAFRQGEEVDDGGLDVGDLRPVAVGVRPLLPQLLADPLDRRVPLCARDGDVRFPSLHDQRRVPGQVPPRDAVAGRVSLVSAGPDRPSRS